MKTILKVILIIVIIWLAFALLFCLWGTFVLKKTSDTVVDAGKEFVNTIQEEETKGDITLDEFNQIKVGMSYSEVVKLVGAEGTFSSETQIGGKNYKYYTWDGVGVGASASISFYNNKVYSKTQFNLK